MRKIVVVTGSRSEYGLLYWTMKEIINSKKLELSLLVSGMHLLPQFGLTVNEIEKDGFDIDDKIEILLSTDTEQGISKSIGLGVLGFTQAFERLKPDILLILGDRFEIFAAATAAMAMNIPIAHISGGEVTEGVIDEQIRHAITKMSHLHFPGAEEYKQNILNMGEEVWRVFNVGDPGIENIKKLKLLSKKQLEDELQIDLSVKNVLVTFHPVTLEKELLLKQVRELLYALKELRVNIIFTYPNSDSGGKLIINEINKFIDSNKYSKAFKSLGSLRYLSLMSLVDAIIGNSSSGIVEAPLFKKPVINIGSRQSGRLKAQNIIDVECTKEDILKAWDIICNCQGFKSKLQHVKSLYGEGSTSKEIVKVLETVDLGNKLLRKKFNVINK